MESKPILSKSYSISESSKLCEVPINVLRNWGKIFFQLKPKIKYKNRKYYVWNDILLIRRIKYLIYNHGLTIEETQKKIASSIKQENDQTNISVANNLMHILTELKKILTTLDD